MIEIIIESLRSYGHLWLWGLFLLIIAMMLIVADRDENDLNDLRVVFYILHLMSPLGY